ncbi:MAG: GNAT family N-acetyltransferase [Pseudomonadota bacterium]
MTTKPGRSAETSPEFTLRWADLADLDDAVTLVTEFHAAEHVDQSAENRRNAVAMILADRSLGEFWMVEVDGQIAGYICIAYGFAIEFNGRDAFLDEFFMRPAYRGHGIGSRALMTVVKGTATRGIKAMHLEVMAGNEAAMRIYEAQGFRHRQHYHLMSAYLGET